MSEQLGVMGEDPGKHTIDVVMENPIT